MHKQNLNSVSQRLYSPSWFASNVYIELNSIARSLRLFLTCLPTACNEFFFKARIGSALLFVGILGSCWLFLFCIIASSYQNRLGQVLVTRLCWERKCRSIFFLMLSIHPYCKFTSLFWRISRLLSSHCFLLFFWCSVGSNAFPFFLFFLFFIFPFLFECFLFMECKFITCLCATLLCVYVMHICLCGL